MKKLFLLDAYAIIYKAYYAFIRNPRINSKGMNTSAIFGFVNTLEDVLKSEKPTHIAVAFDPKGKTFRHEAYEHYKAQREATPEDIRIAVPIIKNIVEAYNIPVLEKEGFEADDVIGTLAKKAGEEGFEVFMLTPDKDYGQLVSENIFIYKPKYSGGYEKLGPKEVQEKYGLKSQEQVIDLLGLMGDSSDNIPGCPGVGEKTAIKLLEDFGSIENVLENTEKIKGALKTKIEENKEQIIFSKFLATIKTDVPIEFEEEKLITEAPNETKLSEIFDELEFRTLKARILGNSITEESPKKTSKISDTGQMSLFGMEEETKQITPNNQETIEATFRGLQTLKDVPHTYKLIKTESERKELIEKLMRQTSVCFDTETTGIDVMMADLVGLSFCCKKGEAYFVSLPDERKECTRVMNEFKPFFENEKIEKIGHNIKFDLQMISSYNVGLKGKLFDTMIAHYLIQPELRHGMDYLAEIYLKYQTVHYTDLVGQKGKNQLSINMVDLDLLSDYACEDADVTFQLKQILEKELQKNNQEKLFYDIEMPLMRVLAIMEQNGVRIDVETLKQTSVILTNEMLALEKEIIEMAGVAFNVGSPMQVGEVLFDKMKLDEKAKKTKTGQYSTSEDILEKLRSKHPIVGKILDYRGLKKLLSTYIDALPQMVNPKTGKIHTSYNQTVAATGRLSSTNPNLQNIPVRDELGREIRKVFIPDDNCIFLSADYSQIELRIMAHLSGDKNMIDAFNSGNDIHAATAAKIYKIQLPEVTSDMRRKAKTANFGIIYGISIFGLAERLNIPRSEAKELIEGYFATYPQVKAYMENAIQKAKAQGYVETIYGRKRFLPDINSQNSIVRGFAERNAINAPIQGSAADIIKIAMIYIQNRIEKENLRTKMTMQVHDELNFSVPKEEIEKAKALVISEMESVIKMAVPLIADAGTGENWLEAH
ncbi:DNA polymerase I [uncultured Paludibacter sp.]|uniref:DNA polymerase I n=1 Tax=uncultured Paludibacter sp. TaxID=497635 RepID=A0A653AIG0_9BACT|nr:DNA polymerase I [uncultured Paludibacter sp.]